MNKPNNLSYRQRLALQVGRAASSDVLIERTSFPYGFEAYARCAARCTGRKLEAHAMYLGPMEVK